MRENSSRADSAALLALTLGVLEAVNAGTDPREQVCVELRRLTRADCVLYLAVGPERMLVLATEGPCRGWLLGRPALARIATMLPAAEGPFEVLAGTEVAWCLPASPGPTWSRGLVLAGDGVDLQPLRSITVLLRQLERLCDRRWPLGPGRAEPVLLTTREQQVLTLLAEGLLARTIALRLGISPRTVHHHLRRIYEKLAVQDRLTAVLRAREAGLLDEAHVPSPAQ